MRTTVMAFAVTALVSASAGAQQVDKRGVPFRPWDINASIGLSGNDGGDIGLAAAAYDDVDVAGAFGFDVGRYWNSHLKTEVGVLLRPGWSRYDSDQVLLPNAQGAYIWSRTEVTPAQVMVGATWQFLENTFAHPYLSAGARVGVFRIHTTTEAFGRTLDGRYVVPRPARDDRRTTRVVRPFVAGGFKSYFSERVFVRPELAIGFSGDAVGQFALRIGFGVDF